MLLTIRLIILTAILAGTTLGSAHDKVPPGARSPSVTVSGTVENKLVLSVDDLRKFPFSQIAEVRLPPRASDFEGTPRSIVKGVRLRDIVEQAVIVKKDHNTVKKIAVIAIASDGYKVVFSWSELFNTDIGAEVLVLFERDGRPLSAEEGPLVLISGKDISTGPRHVKWLQAIEVRQIVD